MDVKAWQWRSPVEMALGGRTMRVLCSCNISAQGPRLWVSQQQRATKYMQRLGLRVHATGRSFQLDWTRLVNLLDVSDFPFFFAWRSSW